MPTAHDEHLDGTLALHEDAQIAALIWIKLLPTSFTGSLACSSSSHLTQRAMTDSLAVIQRETPFKGLYADVVDVMDAYDDDLLNWEDARAMIEAVLR